MLDSRLEELTRQLFPVDESAKHMFAGELLESLDIELAEAALAQGRSIPAESYTTFDSHVRLLQPDAERANRLQTFDVTLAATLARLLSVRESFVLATWRDESAGGPYVFIDRKEDRYEVTLLSNYRKLEPRENWFAAALSLFEWYSADSEILGIKIFRKSWALTEDITEIASAISLVMTYVLDALASQRTLIAIPRLEDQVLELACKSWVVDMYLDDASVGWRLTAKADQMGFHPPISESRAGLESATAQRNIREALEIAEQNDDEVGIYSLTQLLDDVVAREKAFEAVMPLVSEFVALARDLPSRRLLPEDHPDYEEPFDEDAEDDDDTVIGVDSGLEKPDEGDEVRAAEAAESVEAVEAPDVPEPTPTPSVVAAPTPSQPVAPPGWYDDGSGQMRWWDGQTWGVFQQASPVPQNASLPLKNSMATAGLVLGLVSLLLNLLLVPSILGIIFSSIGISRANRLIAQGQPQAAKKSLSLWGLWLSILGIVGSILFIALAL